MIYFFNEMICILLVIAITIIFIKTIYSNKIQFVTNEEHFSNRLITSPTYYKDLDLVNTDKKWKDLIAKLLKDREFIQFVNESYKKDLNSANFNSKSIQTNKEETSRLLNDIIQSRKKLTEIPDRYDTIYNKFKNLNDNYKNKKKKIESILVNDFEETNINEFNKNNRRLIKKLKVFTDSLGSASSSLTSGLGAGRQGKILKNIATNNEFILITNSGIKNREKYTNSAGLSSKDGEDIIYYLSLNEGGKVLEINSKAGKDWGVITEHSSNNIKQFFTILKIKNNNIYNKYIKLSGNYSPKHLINEVDTSIKYPFYIISPFSIPGHCIVNINKDCFIGIKF